MKLLNPALNCILALFILSLLTMCQSKTIKQTDDNKNKLMGVWGPSINENASFWIQQDSVYYPEHFKSYKYSTKKDSIFIFYEGWIVKAKYSFSHDSLIMRNEDKVERYVRFTNTKDLKSSIADFEAYYKILEKDFYDSTFTNKNDNIDFSSITSKLKDLYDRHPDPFYKTFLGFKLAQNYYTHFESSHKIEYREMAKPLFISFINFKNGAPAAQYLKLDIMKVHLIVNKWDSYSEKDQEDIMRYGLLRGFDNGLPEILNKQ